MIKKQESLAESYYYILLCLYENPNHGYGIVENIKQISEGKIRIGSGSMYMAVSNMLKRGWIKDKKLLNNENDEKTTYEITKDGIEVLNSEVGRVKQFIKSVQLVIN